MRFESRTFWLAKDAGSPEQFQDAFDLDPRRGVAAIADGVTSGIFSGPWARLLTRAIVAQPPNLDDADDFHSWLGQLRAEWLAGIDLSRLTWFQRPKMVDGGMTTLLWIELLPPLGGNGLAAPDEAIAKKAIAKVDPITDEVRGGAEISQTSGGCSAENGATIQQPLSAATIELGAPTAYRLRAYAIGDSFLFHVRAGQVLAMFPFENSATFGLNPAVIGSLDRQTDHLLQFQMIENDCRSGDLLVLCTDALALWAMNCWEAGEPVDWARYWDMPPDVWQEEMYSLRRESLMRYDDTTLVLLKVTEDRSDATAETECQSADAAIGAIDAVDQAPLKVIEPCVASDDFTAEQLTESVPSEETHERQP